MYVFTREARGKYIFLSFLLIFFFLRTVALLLLFLFYFCGGGLNLFLQRGLRDMGTGGGCERVFVSIFGSVRAIFLLDC